MSGRGRRPKREAAPQGGEEPGLGTFLAAGAVAVGVGALMYGAKKLYDYVNTETRVMESCGASSSSSSGFSSPQYTPPKVEAAASRYPQATAPKQPMHTPTSNMPASPSQQSAMDAAPKKESLSESLHAYYEDYVRIPSREMQSARHALEEIQTLLSDQILQHNPDLGACRLQEFGSSTEDLQVIVPTSFDLMLPIDLKTKVWKVTPAVETATVSPGSFCVQRINTSSTIKGSHAMDTYLDSSMCLSAEKISQELAVAVENVAALTAKYTVIMKSTLAFEVTYELPSLVRKSFTVNIHPALVVEGSLLLPKISFSQGNDIVNGSSSSVWQKSFAAQEMEHLRMFSAEETCHLKCLKIIKAVRLNHPSSFGVLPTYVYKSVLLHMMADTPEVDFWRNECLQEQFVDILNQLVYYLQGRRLPCFYDSSINLLDGVPQERCEELVNFIITRIGKEKLHTLLDRNYNPTHREQNQ